MHLPGHRTRREIFEDDVTAAAHIAIQRFGHKLRYLQVTVEDAPPSDPAPWEDNVVPLGRYFPSDRLHPPRIVMYRRPIVTRCADPSELSLLIRQVLSEQIGAMLSRPPEEIDPQAWDV
ncbi:metallopeptidase family protein [Devriesea agamarum]|uniref:metallopeptidase family protein n=1 Tax=Devriesea agamarum TaxID=472569 RepID=UPI0009FBC5DB|nr:metallopeptidase family protein [Devriesea agamarum]